jgi:hypothetical protein
MRTVAFTACSKHAARARGHVAQAPACAPWPSQPARSTLPVLVAMSLTATYTSYTAPQLRPPTTPSLQVLLGASAVAAGAWAVKQLAGPYLSGLYHRLRPGGSHEEDGQKGPTPEQAALAAASAELKQSVEALVEVARSLQQPVGGGTGGVDVAEEVRRELREFAGMLQR